MKFSLSTKYLFLIFLISFFLFLPSLSTFYTNDDFFLLKISQANSVKEFLNFFNLTRGPDGLGMYRPLTTQVFYFLARKIFNLNPLGLHVISFFIFFAVIFLVYKFCLLLLNDHKSPFTNHISLLAAFLYATSATHFGHLYFLGAFQELGLALFFLLSVLSFIKFLHKSSTNYLLLSLLFFVLSLLSKETAVVLPLCLFLIYIFFKLTKKSAPLPINRLIASTAPYFLILIFYFYFRFAYYGFATGDSYVWDFSVKRAVNTLGWYGLWSFNLPEMLVDFVGPGFHFNPNLFKYWSSQIIPILTLFLLELFLLSAAVYKFFSSSIRKLEIRNLKLVIFGTSWFLITLLPVLFLPLHKFTFYLTLPLMGVVVFISYSLVTNHKPLAIFSFLAIWLILSVLTLNLTAETNWITKGAQTAKRVHNYFLENAETLEKYKTIAFYDTDEDNDLPWSPTEILKVTLSDQNYFKVFWNNKLSAEYKRFKGDFGRNTWPIESRQFLGY